MSRLPRVRRPWSPRRPWSLRRRLVTATVALLALVAGITGAVSTLALRGSLVGQIDDRLVATSGRAVQAPGGEPGPGPRPGGTTATGEATDQATDQTAEPAPETGVPAPETALPDDAPPAANLLGQEVGTVNLFRAAGSDQARASVLHDSGEPRALTAEQSAALLAVPTDGTPVAVELPGLGGYRAVSVVTQAGDTVVTALPTADADATVRRYVTVEVGVVLAGLLLVWLIGRVVVRRELAPLTRVAATATRVADLPLHHGEVELADRVPAADTDPATEVGQVGAALNRLLGHVEHALAARHDSETQVRRFVADASHELRTPLASIRGYAELVRRLPGDLPDDALRAMGRVESEARRMTALVEDMLLLARLDAGQDLDQAAVDVTALAVDAVADARAAGPDHGWVLDLAGLADDDGEGFPDLPEAPATTVLGDEPRLRQVLANLLANARVHTPAGTTVTVRVRQQDGDVVVAVHDDGPGVPEGLRDHLFERFTRGDRARTAGGSTGLGSSTGLGLAIAHAVVTAHGGGIEVASVPGSTTFTVRLPAAG